MSNSAGKLSMEELLTLAAGNSLPDTNPDPDPDSNPNPDPDSNPNPDSDSNPNPNPDPSPDPDPNPNPDPNPDSDSTPKTDPKPKPKPKPKPNPIKEIRDRYNTEKSTREKIDNAIQRFTNGDYSFKLKDFVVEGKMDYDALITSMDEADLKAKADSRGINPEVQAEIERIEKEKIELEKQKLQVAMDRALTELQLEMNIRGAEINNFFKDAMAVNKNPYRWLAQGGNLLDLYNIIYKDKLLKAEIDKALAEAKAKWEEEHARQTRVPTPNPAPGAKPREKNPDGLSLEALLAEAAARNK
jgi:hypothetical protein